MRKRFKRRKAMKTTIKKVTLSEKDTLANLLEKYNYEFSQYDKRQFNNNGLFGYKYLNNYFTEESRYRRLKFNKSIAGHNSVSGCYC